MNSLHESLGAQPADEILGSEECILVIEALAVLDYHNFQARVYMILSDSGRIPKEILSLGDPVG